MKKLFLLATILLAYHSVAQVEVTPATTSKFIVTFKLSSSDDLHKVKDVNVTIHHEEQWPSFQAFKATLKQNHVLSFDGKSVGNTFQALQKGKGIDVKDFKIKCLDTNKSISLKGVTIKSVKKSGGRFLSEIEYLSVK